MGMPKAFQNLISFKVKLRAENTMLCKFYLYVGVSDFKKLRGRHENAAHEPSIDRHVAGKKNGQLYQHLGKRHRTNFVSPWCRAHSRPYSANAMAHHTCTERGLYTSTIQGSWHAAEAGET